MKQAPDEITIVTKTPARADFLQQTITLRGFDEIACLDTQSAIHACRINPPVLVIVDMEGDLDETVRFLESLPAGVKSLVLADVFEESAFLACHDLGARDFMVHPVPEAMLISRVIRNLQDHRLEQVSRQKDRTLVEMGVLSAQSGVFTTSYLINLLRQQTEEALLNPDESMSLLMVQLKGLPEHLSAAARQKVMSAVGATIKECARGLDEVGEYLVDKFAVVMPETSLRGAKALGNRIQQRLNGLKFDGPAGAWALSVRVGVADSANCRDYEAFLNQAMADLATPEVKPDLAAVVQQVTESVQSMPSQAVVSQSVPPLPPAPLPNIPPMSRPSNLI